MQRPYDTTVNEATEMTEYVSCHSIIYETEDDDGRIKYYTTNMDFNHSWLCEVDIEDLDEIKPDFKVEYTRLKEESK